jgi:hypothetical protein
VPNIIFDLGGVVFDWNPESILEGYYVDPHSRATMKAAAQALGLHTVLFQDARQCGAELEHWLGAG